MKIDRDKERSSKADSEGDTPIGAGVLPDVRAAAVSLVERPDGRILCVWNKRYNGWSLPGGKVEDGEKPHQAQARELREECGVETRLSRLAFKGDHGIKVDSTRGSCVYVYRVIISGEPSEVEEGCPIRWLTRKEFLELSPFSSFYERVFKELPHPFWWAPDSDERAKVVERVCAWAARVTSAIDSNKDLDSDDELESAMDAALMLGRFLKRGGTL